MRKKHNPACPCCGGCEGSIRAEVRHCTSGSQSLTSGATVDVYDDEDNLVGSGTTDALGIVEIDITAAGTYRVEATKAGLGTVYEIVEATCTRNDVSLYMGEGITITVTGCGCATPGVSVRVTRTTPAYDRTEVTNGSGQAFFPVPGLSGSTLSYQASAVPTGYLTTSPASTGVVPAFTCTIARSIAIASPAGHWCYGGNPGICLDESPAAVDVTIPNNATHFGSLAGTTVSVPRLSPTLNTFRKGFAFGGGSAGAFIGYSHLGVTVTIAGSGTCTTPSATVNMEGSASDAGAGGVGGPVAIASKDSGTAACPVAFACSQYALNSGGGPVTHTGTTTVAE